MDQDRYKGPLGKRVESVRTEDGRLWVAMQAGSLPGDTADYVTLSLALGALHEALATIGIGPKFGPAPVAVTIPEESFILLRDALLASHDSHAAFFKRRQRNKRIDPALRSFMMHGITVRAGDLSDVSMRCPLHGRA